jgi:hypothetical protein
MVKKKPAKKKQVTREAGSETSLRRYITSEIDTLAKDSGVKLKAAEKAELAETMFEAVDVPFGMLLGSLFEAYILGSDDGEDEDEDKDKDEDEDEEDED